MSKKERKTDWYCYKCLCALHNGCDDGTHYQDTVTPKGTAKFIHDQCGGDVSAGRAK